MAGKAHWALVMVVYASSWAGSVRMPLTTHDFVPFMQRAKDARPDAVFVFVPGGKESAAFMKAFGDLGLGAAGIKLIGTGDVTTDEELPGMGAQAIGTITTPQFNGFVFPG